jgi:hypothetical protein
MDNIIRCSSCKKVIIAEEEHTHKCIFDVIEIPITDYYERNSNIVAWALNGKVYRLVKSASPKWDNPPKNPKEGQNRFLLKNAYKR